MSSSHLFQPSYVVCSNSLGAVIESAEYDPTTNNFIKTDFNRKECMQTTTKWYSTDTVSTCGELSFAPFPQRNLLNSDAQNPAIFIGEYTKDENISNHNVMSMDSASPSDLNQENILKDTNCVKESTMYEKENPNSKKSTTNLCDESENLVRAITVIEGRRNKCQSKSKRLNQNRKPLITIESTTAQNFQVSRNIILHEIDPEFLMKNPGIPDLVANRAENFFSELKSVFLQVNSSENLKTDKLTITQWFTMIDSLYNDLIYARNNSTLVKIVKYYHILDLILSHFKECSSRYKDLTLYIRKLEAIQTWLSAQNNVRITLDEHEDTFFKRNNINIRQLMLKYQFGIDSPQDIGQTFSEKNELVGIELNSDRENPNTKDKVDQVPKQNKNSFKKIDIFELTYKIDQMHMMIEGTKCYEMFEKISLCTLEYLSYVLKRDLDSSDAEKYIDKCKELINEKNKITGWKNFVEKILERSLLDNTKISADEIYALCSIIKSLKSWKTTTILLRKIEKIFQNYKVLSPIAKSQQKFDKAITPKESSEKLAISSNISKDLERIDIIPVVINRENQEKSNVFEISESVELKSKKISTNKNISPLDKPKMGMKIVKGILSEKIKLDGNNTLESDLLSNNPDISHLHLSTVEKSSSAEILSSECLREDYKYLQYNKEYNDNEKDIPQKNVAWENNLECLITTNTSFLPNSIDKEPVQIHVRKPSTDKPFSSLQENNNNLKQVIAESSYSNDPRQHRLSLADPRKKVQKGFENTVSFITYKLQKWDVEKPYVRYPSQLEIYLKQKHYVDPRLELDRKRLEKIQHAKSDKKSDFTHEKIFEVGKEKGKNQMASENTVPRDPRLEKCKELETTLKQRDVKETDKSSYSILDSCDTSWCRIPFRGENSNEKSWSFLSNGPIQKNEKPNRTNQHLNVLNTNEPMNWNTKSLRNFKIPKINAEVNPASKTELLSERGLLSSNGIYLKKNKLSKSIKIVTNQLDSDVECIDNRNKHSPIGLKLESKPISNLEENNQCILVDSNLLELEKEPSKGAEGETTSQIKNQIFSEKIIKNRRDSIELKKKIKGVKNVRINAKCPMTKKSNLTCIDLFKENTKRSKINTTRNVSAVVGSCQNINNNNASKNEICEHTIAVVKRGRNNSITSTKSSIHPTGESFEKHDSSTLRNEDNEKSTHMKNKPSIRVCRKQSKQKCHSEEKNRTQWEINITKNDRKIEHNILDAPFLKPFRNTNLFDCQVVINNSKIKKKMPKFPTETVVKHQ